MTLTKVTRRLQVEFAKLNRGTPPGITLVPSDEPTFESVLMDIELLNDHPIYKGMIFRLKFIFDDGYPNLPPDVRFVTVSDPHREVPLHPHIYSTGIICLDLLSDSGWSPIQSVQSLCLSIQSILSDNDIASRPDGDASFIMADLSSMHSREIQFEFHDDTV